MYSAAFSRDTLQVSQSSNVEALSLLIGHVGENPIAKVPSRHDSVEGGINPRFDLITCTRKAFYLSL